MNEQNEEKERGEKYLEAFKKKYFRSVISYPEGAFVHDGDCQVFRCRICSCGFFHELLYLETYSHVNETIKEISKKHFKGMQKHAEMCDYVFDNKDEIISKLWSTTYKNLPLEEKKKILDDGRKQIEKAFKYSMTEKELKDWYEDLEEE